MHIALFGGGFDPPHKSHLTIAQNILSAHLVDEIWFVPCGSHPFNKNMSGAKHRLQMTRLMLQENMRVIDYEIKKTGKSFSYKTLSYFSKKYPPDTFSWIIGSDQLTSFHKWGSYKQLLEDFTIYVYPCAGHPFVPYYDGMVLLHNLPAQSISSTQIRTLLAKDLSVDGLLHPEVLCYIQKHALYNKHHDADSQRPAKRN